MDSTWSVLSFLPSIVVLGLVAAAAARLAQKPTKDGQQPERGRAARVLCIATIVQGIHFIEEVSTGFHERLPALIGEPRMPLSIFVAFNLVWLIIWMASVPGLSDGRRGAFFAAWFLAIAGILNGIAHPLLALASNGYFPGLVTSPFIGAAGVWLCLSLRRATN